MYYELLVVLVNLTILHVAVTCVSHHSFLDHQNDNEMRLASTYRG